MPMEGDVEKKNRDVQAAIEKVECVHSDVDKLEKQVSELRQSVVNGEQTDDKRFEVMGELLMVQLLKLDGIEVEGEARAQRKAEVKRVQELVDNVDNLKLEKGRALVPVSAPGIAPGQQEQNWVSFSNGLPPQQANAVAYQQPKQQQSIPTNTPAPGNFHRQSHSVSSPSANNQTPPQGRTTARSVTPGSGNSTSSSHTSPTPSPSRQQYPLNALPDPQAPYGYPGRAASNPNMQSPPSTRPSPPSGRRVASIASTIALDDDDFDPRGDGQNGGGGSSNAQSVPSPQSGPLNPKPSPDRGTFAPSPLGSHSRQSSRSSSIVPLPSERRSRDPSPRREASERRGFSGASPGRSRSVDPHEGARYQQNSGRQQHYGDEDGRRSMSRPSSRGGEEGGRSSQRRQASESRQQVEMRDEETGGRGGHVPWNISQRDYSQRRDNTPQRDVTPQREHTPHRERERDYQRNHTPQREFAQPRELTPQRSERGGREYVSPGPSRGERDYSRRAGGEGQRPPSRHTSPLPRGSHDRSYVADRQGAYASYGERDLYRNGGRDEREVYGGGRGDEWDANRGGEQQYSSRNDYGGGREQQYGRSDRDVYAYGGRERDPYAGGRTEREQYRGSRYDDREPSRDARERERWEGAGGYGKAPNVGYATTPQRGTVQEYGSGRMQPFPEATPSRLEMERYERAGGRQTTSIRSLAAFPSAANGDVAEAKWETFDVGATYSNASRAERNWTQF